MFARPLSQLFFYKSNSPGFSSYFVILVSLPVGRWLARNVPERTVVLPLIGTVELNPGPFSIKEHLLVGVIGELARRRRGHGGLHLTLPVPSLS